MNKRESPDILARVGGSVAIGAAARSGLLAAPDPKESNAGVRVLVHFKHSLSAKAPALRYRIEERTITAHGRPLTTTSVVWLGESNDVHIEDLLTPATAPDQAERLEAADWLRETLRDGPRASKRIFAEAKRAGFSERTVWRAKKALGAVSKRVGRDFSWSLP